MESRDRIEQLNKQISDLPVGYISKKNIRGKECYYRQWKEDGKVKSQYVADKDLDYTISLINRRKELQLELQYESAKLACETDENRLEPYARRFFMSRHVGRRNTELREDNHSEGLLCR